MKDTFCGQAGRAYNAGSETAVTITELANIVAEATKLRFDVQIVEPAATRKSAERYVLANDWARAELALLPEMDLVTAIKRTVAWHRQKLIQREGEGF